MPDSFQSVEFGRIWGKIVNLDIAALVGKPTPDLPILVVGCIVLDQEDFPAKVTPDHLLQITDRGTSIEEFLKVIEETACIEFDRAKCF